MSRFLAIVALLASALVGCVVAPAPNATPHEDAIAAPVVLTCGAHSFLAVGTYEGRWADWTLTVDAAGHTEASLAVVDGPRTTVDGDEPALTVRLPGDCVDFSIWAADRRGHFVQSYPGLPHGYDVAVDCEGDTNR